MRSPGSRYRRIGLSAAVAAFVVAALLVSVPAPTAAQPSVSATPAQTSGGVTYLVTWNDVNVNTASTLSSAFTMDLSQSVSLSYNWTVAVGATPVTISDARLQMYYLGFAVSTRDQILTSPAPGSGHIPLSWTPISVAYLLEGAYRLTASFIAPNGTTMWSENFWVRGTAPYGIFALLPIVLLIIILYEVYGLARSGRYAAIGAPAAAAPPPSPPASPPSSPPTEAAPPSGGPTETGAPAEDSGGAEPPSGGSA